MTSLQDKQVKERYLRNSGDPAEAFGVLGSGSVEIITADAGLFLDLMAETGFVTYQGMAHSTGFGMSPGYFGGAAAVATATIAERTKSREQVAFELQKSRLVGAIKAMAASAPNWYGSFPTKINDLSAESAEKFIESLPGNAILPRLAPDGEGDIMFVWDDALGRSPVCVVTVEKRSLHLARGLGTSHEEHIDAQRFLGVKIPDPILERLPSK